MASVLAGPKFDTRFRQNDTGLNYTFQLSALDVRYEDYNNSLNVVLGQDRFAERRNGDLAAHYILQREFAPGTSDSLHIFTTNQRRDNYASFEGDIESLRERQNGFENRLIYTVAPGIHFNLYSELTFKNVHVLSSSAEVTQKQRKRNDQRFNNELNMFIRRRNLNSRIMLSYWSQAQRYDIEVGDSRVPFSKRTSFVTPDNESSRLSLATVVGTRLSRADSLYSFVSVNKYQYDTPDTNNFDDRDELRINGRLTAVHHFSEMLKVDIQASVNLFHMVYIFGERSADNNWNRIFRLRPGIHFRPGDRFRFSQVFEVLANYVDYDFNDEFSLTKSFVFRKFAMDDSLRLQITDRTRLRLDYRLQLEENGQLNWDEWSERVLATRQNQWLHVHWHYHIADKFVLAPGYTFYRRDEWRHEADQFGVERQERQGSHISHGPVFRLYYRPSRRIRLIFDGVRYAVKPAAGKEYYTNNLELTMNLYL